MLKKIILIIIATITIILILGLFQPKEMLVFREIEISEKPEIIFPYINNSKKSYDWMPWAESDPTAKIEFSGPEEGIGAKSNWNGKDMGVGQSEVVESQTNQYVKTKLDYTEPFIMSQLAEISLTPNQNGTLVKWSIRGEKAYLFRIMGIFYNCDNMIGGEFEKGLKKLKSLIESK